MLIFLSRTLYFVFSPPIYFGFISEYSFTRLFRLNIAHANVYISIKNFEHFVAAVGSFYWYLLVSLWYTYYMHSKRIVIAKVLAECRFMVPFPQLFDGTTVRSARLDEINYSGILYSRR